MLEQARPASVSVVREFDERLGLATFIAKHLSDSRRGLNTQFGLADLLRRFTAALAGYEDLNDAERLVDNPALRLIGTPKMWDRGAAPRRRRTSKAARRGLITNCP